MNVIQVIPILRIFDYQKTIEFYIDWLGFKIDWEHKFHKDAPIYIQISKEEMTLHLTEHHGDCTPGAKVFIQCKGLKEFHKNLKKKRYKYNNPGIQNAPWKDLCMEVTDPFRNKLVFNEKR